MATQKLQYIDAGMVAKMSALLTRQSPEEVQSRLGIGMNTWTKLRKGEAIRQSVAERLLERLQGRLVN